MDGGKVLGWTLGGMLVLMAILFCIAAARGSVEKIADVECRNRGYSTAHITWQGFTLGIETSYCLERIELDCLEAFSD